MRCTSASTLRSTRSAAGPAEALPEALSMSLAWQKHAKASWRRCAATQLFALRRTSATEDILRGAQLLRAPPRASPQRVFAPSHAPARSCSHRGGSFPCARTPHLPRHTVHGERLKRLLCLSLVYCMFGQIKHQNWLIYNPC